MFKIQCPYCKIEFPVQDDSLFFFDPLITGPDFVLLKFQYVVDCPNEVHHFVGPYLFTGSQVQAGDGQEFTHTVHCYDDKSLRKHCTSLTEAVDYANGLLKQKHSTAIFPYNYQSGQRYVDIVAERGPDG